MQRMKSNHAIELFIVDFARFWQSNIFITCLGYLKIRTNLPKIKQIKIDRIICENAKVRTDIIYLSF